MIAENLFKIKKSLPKHVKLVAVSKTKPESEILEAYNAGHRIFGENKVQECVKKYENLPKDIEWHFIGHLQTNKVKFIAPFISLIHAVDSKKLLEVINKEAKKNSRIIDVLLQVHIAEEESKFGLNKEELFELLTIIQHEPYNSVRIKGLMGMATLTEDVARIEQEFQFLKMLFEKAKQQPLCNSASFSELSMGMSGDYKIAIEQGSTLIRIGSTIFGDRNYNL